MAEEEKEDDSDTNSIIITVSELIDSAFGDLDMNIVNHKHIQTVLFILARQLRILQRRVEVQLSPYQVKLQKTSSTLSISEVKIQAVTESKQRLVMEKWRALKGPLTKPHRGNQEGKGSKTSVPGETSTSKTSTNKTARDKVSTDKAPDETSASDKKLSANKRSTAGKTSAEDDISDDDTQSTTEKTSKTRKKPTTGKSSAADETSGPDKKSSAGEKSTSGKSSSAGKTSHEDDISDDEELSTTDKTSKSGGKTAIARVEDADKTTSADKTSSTGKKSSTDKTSSDKTSSGDKKQKMTQLQDYQRILNEVEEMRERELRVIRQRVDSREEPEKSPTPLALMDSFEATYEKLLVVERVTPEEAKARAARERSGSREETVPRVSFVTQEQFKGLANTVTQIQNKLAPIGTPDFPENAQLMKELRKGASLTDAMAALQLSARLEGTEKTLKNLLSIVTDLASQTPGLKLTEGGTDNIEVLFGASDGAGKQGKVGKKLTDTKSGKEKMQKDIENAINLSPVDSDEILMPTTPHRSSVAVGGDIKKIVEIITFQELEEALENIYDDIMKQVTEKTTHSTTNAENAMKLVTSLEKRIDVSINLGNKMEALENLVSNYSEQVNILDTGLSSQLTNFQEELTQMQHDLETGLETMAEVLANTGGDAAAVSELNARFNDLQLDIDNAVRRQNELRNIQSGLFVDLEGLRAAIETLRGTKSDRDEVVDALRDKAGLGDLNGLVSQEQFDAVRGDIEKHISTAYDKFNNQETVWQKAIDDLLREINEKADLIQVNGLRDEINYYLEMLRKKMKVLTDVVGEPDAAAITRKLARDAACLSCTAPAHMKTEENMIPLLPAVRPPTIGAETPIPKEDGDHGLCYQGHPVKHPIDPRGHMCNRWCGGSHTLIKPEQISRIPPSVTVTSLNRKVGQERGTDGKMYAVDDLVLKKPCAQCIIPVPPVVEKPNKGIVHVEDTPSFQYRPQSAIADYDVTPPL